MSIFQCDSCGCAENTALSRGVFGPRFQPEKAADNKLDPKGRYCSSCWDGVWHGKFERRFYPMGSMVTDHEGNLKPRGEVRHG
jgi:hypothetical protein